MTIFSETELETIAKEQIGEDKTAVKVMNSRVA